MIYIWLEQPVWTLYVQAGERCRGLNMAVWRYADVRLGCCLQGMEPELPAGPGFVFRAQQAPDQGTGQVAARPHKSRRRQTATFKPFHLSTHVSIPAMIQAVILQVSVLSQYIFCCVSCLS